MFYTCAMNAGDVSDEYFPRANMTGENCIYMEETKVLQWLDDVEEYGLRVFEHCLYVCYICSID